MNWWREVETWTLMERGSLLVGAAIVLAGGLWRTLAVRRERAHLEALVASRTRQLRQSEELFRSIFEHASEGIFQSSLDGRNLRANPAMARLCGYADPDEMQRELRDVATQFYVRPDRRQEINAAVALEGAALDWESEIRRRDGSIIWINESVRAVVEPTSGRTVYQGSIVDITARREMQAAREQARADAEAASTAKSTFLAHMTHELRTPLTGILSNARVALLDPALAEKDRARFGLIVTSGEHLLALINEVLDLSRIEAGRMELRAGPFRLGELLRTIEETFQQRATEDRLEFRCTVDATLPRTVDGDAIRLRQVLDNLLGNAFNFTERGSIMLHVGRYEDTAPGMDKSGSVWFEVVDTGIGIPTSRLASIFKPFEQVVHPGRSAPAGAGLGLHISARLVDLMGGELRVKSALGQGSRFYFDVPLPDAGGGEILREVQEEHLGPATAEPALAARLPVRALPATSEIDALLTLCLEGDIVRLRTRLRELAESDKDLTEFVREVDSLATGFRMDAIGVFLERCKTQEQNTNT